MATDPGAIRWLDRASTSALRRLPTRRLAQAMYWLARVRWPPLKRLLIRFLVDRYEIDLDEAADPDLDHYPHFNAFFTRALRPECRPIAAGENNVTCPVDGRVSQVGRVRGDRLIQAKGHDYSLQGLLAGDADLTAQFRDGSFATLYLSPRDYHRVHMPLGGRLRRMLFVPGELNSVSEATAQLVPGLFARNERLIILFDTSAGNMALVLVGAIFVGSIETVWAGEIREKGPRPSYWSYPPETAPHLAKGTEMGRFNMGSTVILLFPKGRTAWVETLAPGDPVRLGECIAELCPAPGPVD